MNQESGVKSTKIKSFTDLEAWKQAHQLTLHIYKITRLFPEEEKFSLTSQIRRAAISIGSNIAEGFSRFSYPDKKHFYTMSLGSTTELQNQILIARDLKYINEEEFNTIAQKSVIVNKLLNGLIKRSGSKSP